MLPSFRDQRDQMALDMAEGLTIAGVYTSSNTSSFNSLNGTFTFTQLFSPTEPLVRYHYIMDGCYRDPSWPIYLQSLDWKFLFILAPLFIFCLATLNGQRVHGWRLWVMILFGCCSFIANRVGNMYILGRGDVVSAIGATVVGVLGTICGHFSKGDALPSMIPGILVLLPVSVILVFLTS